MKARIENQTENVVELCEKHYGHELELCHLCLPENERAGKFHQAVSLEHILDHVCDYVSTTVVRIRLLTRKDMRNIEINKS